MIIRIKYSSSERIENVEIGIAFSTMNDTHLFACRSGSVGVTETISKGNDYTECFLPKTPLKAGSYLFRLTAVCRGMVLDRVVNAGIVNVENGDYYGFGTMPGPGEPGVLVNFDWRYGKET